MKDENKNKNVPAGEEPENKNQEPENPTPENPEDKGDGKADGAENPPAPPKEGLLTKLGKKLDGAKTNVGNFCEKHQVKSKAVGFMAGAATAVVVIVEVTKAIVSKQEADTEATYVDGTYEEVPTDTTAAESSESVG